MTGQSPPPNGGRASALVVGVKPEQPDAVVLGAVRFAQLLDARLVLAVVDDTRYTVRHDPDGMVAALSIDGDGPEVIEEAVDPQLAAHVCEMLEPSGAPWELQALSGDPARELARLAHRLAAVAIVVGTRKPGVRRSALDYFGGSVAAQLAHRQHHPVIVIPLNPVAHEETLPWEEVGERSEGSAGGPHGEQHPKEGDGVRCTPASPRAVRE